MVVLLRLLFATTQLPPKTMPGADFSRVWSAEMRLISLLLPSFITCKLVHVKNFILGVLIEFLTWKVMLAQGEGRRREYMKGGEERDTYSSVAWNRNPCV
jgi:hypothetical protein